MVYRTPIERRRRGVRTWRLAALVALVLLIATLLDRTLYHALFEPAAKRNDWYQALRALGYAPTWIAMTLVVLLAERGAALSRGEKPAEAEPRPRRVALAVFLAPAVAGIGAELLKLVIGRERPNAGDGWYVFKPLLSFDDGNLGFPSSHASVAFAGAAVLAIRYRGAGWVSIPLAAGCGLTRLFSGAHYTSDVVAGAMIGLWAAWVISGAMGLRGRAVPRFE